MHREERDIEADEEDPKVDLAELLVEHAPSHLREPIGYCAEEREDSAADENVVEVGDDEVSIMHLEIDRDRCDEDAGHAAHDEDEEEAEDPPHRRLQDDLTRSHSRDPAEDLCAARDGD